MLSLFVAIFLAAAVLFIILSRRKSSKSKSVTKGRESKSSPIIGQAQIDLKYFDRYLSDESSHMDVLFYVATCPDLVNVTATVLKNVSEAKLKRIAAKEGEKDGNNETNDKKDESSLDIDDSGWAEDDDEEDEQAKAAALKAKKADEEREFQRKQLAKATGKLDDSSDKAENMKFEGIDEGVLGQQWVESVLEGEGVWPPTSNQFPGLEKQRNYFEDEDGKKVLDPLDVPAVRRNVCMLIGRLYSQTLNTHPELLKAGPEGNLDATYFRNSMDFRQRNGLLLESTLRMALSSRSYNLAKTIIESICMFKIGRASATEKANINWFNSVILKTYGGIDGLPRLKVSESVIESPGKDVIETGDEGVISLTITRTHAEKFTQHKLDLCKKQNMDPRMALATYQEGWWVLVRAQNLSEEGSEPALISAWPFLVRNIAQKNGKIKCKFQVPDKPGKYKFLFDIKSQDFLGADQSFELLIDVEEGDGADSDDDNDDDDNEESEDDDDEGKKEK